MTPPNRLPALYQRTFDEEQVSVIIAGLSCLQAIASHSDVLESMPCEHGAQLKAAFRLLAIDLAKPNDEDQNMTVDEAANRAAGRIATAAGLCVELSQWLEGVGK